MPDISKTPLGRAFGLDREKKIMKSKVREVFTPHHPVDDVDLLLGRTQEVSKIIETLNTPGQHVLLYGERGIGKSSLANISASVLRAMLDIEVAVKRCDSNDSFETVMLKALKKAKADWLVETYEASRESGISGRFLSTKGGSKATYSTPTKFTPSAVAEAIQALDMLLVIDEVDSLSSAEDRGKLAEVIKLLSDARSKMKLMVVGIAETGDELTAAHPSVQRCLRETKLERMSDPELRSIIETGSEKVGLTFSSAVISEIVDLSAGYPHFTHLMALKCAEDAIAEGRKNIDSSHLQDALTAAVKDAEGSLKRDFDSAQRTHGSDMYGRIIHAAASLGSGELRAQDLRASYAKEFGEEITQGRLNNYLKKLVSDDGSTILIRKAKGVYCFTDPRMASFARIASRRRGHNGS